MRTTSGFVMVLLFAARILIPLVITFGIAYLYDQFQARSQKRSTTTGEFSFQISTSHQEMKACPIPVRAEAACSRWPNLPCWLALQLTEGQVPKECLACVQFEETDLSGRFLD